MRGVFVVLALAGCGMDRYHVNDDDDDDDGDDLAELGVVGIVPSEGPASGGTETMVSGAGFTDGTLVLVGGEPCSALVVISSVEIACTTPAGAPGTVSVQLVRAEDDATASTSFTYTSDSDDTGGSTDDTGGAPDDTGGGGDDTSSTGSEVDYCHVQWPCSMTLSAGAESETVYVWVYQDGVTSGEGQGAGVDVEVGVGSDGTDPAAGGWDWETCGYNTDKDGLASGDLANDEYMGTFTAPSSVGSYDFAARVSVDGGASWTSCDLGGEGCGGSGSTDGYSTGMAGDLTVE